MAEQEFQLPDIMDVSPEATAAAEAALDPDLKVPPTARRDVDKKSGDEYFRWSENVVIEKAQRSRAASGLTVFFIQAKVRPAFEGDNENLGKKVFTRYRLNFKVLAGQEEKPSHAIMNRLSLVALTSLLRATDFLPEDAKTRGLSAALLTHLFPAEVEGRESPLVGKTVVGNVCNRPNKGDGARTPRQTEMESWQPPVEV